MLLAACSNDSESNKAKPKTKGTATDDHSDKVQLSLLGQGGNAPTNGTAVLKAQSDGSFVPTGQTANYACQGNTVTFRFPALTIALERV